MEAAVKYGFVKNLPFYEKIHGHLPTGRASPEIDPSAYVADSANLIGKVSSKPIRIGLVRVTIRGDNERITIGENSNVQEGTCCIPISAIR